MVHSGYEASGVNYTFGSLKGLFETAKALFNRYADPGAQRLLNEWKPAHQGPLVQIGSNAQPSHAAHNSASELQEVSGD
jgi:hypothetical protein